MTFNKKWDIIRRSLNQKCIDVKNKLKNAIQDQQYQMASTSDYNSVEHKQNEI